MALLQSIAWTNRPAVGYHRCIDNGESKMDTMVNQDTIRRIYQALQTGDYAAIT